MKRELENELLKWKESHNRKPLILKGARQVGKTWILKEFGKNNYESVAYFNFEENPEVKQFFSTNFNIQRIVTNLSIFSGVSIKPHDTLIILDEIQECPEAITSLKYFCENGSDYHIACAGSLVGITLSKPTSYPVGKVNLMDVSPMNFSEFLLAEGLQNYSDYMRSIDSIEPIPDAFFTELADRLKTYLITGGMPEVVSLWTQNRDIESVESTLQEIIEVYERDFAKHAQSFHFPKISLIWNSLPAQLARENKKFIFKLVKEGARAREYEDALKWLIDAGLAVKIYRSRAPRLPISAYDDISAFKIYLFDCGILRRLSHLEPSIFTKENRLFTEFKGALTENYILQSLTNRLDVIPRYWSQSNPPYEVDFLIQHKNSIFPVEVKAGKNTTSKSLKKYKELFSKDTKLCIRFSLENLKLDGDVLNIPLFLADITDKLIDIALSYKEP